MKSLLLIALGGAGGALARHWLGAWVDALARRCCGESPPDPANGTQVGEAAVLFPWGTLGVNLLGALCIGLAYVLIVERGLLHPDWRGLLMVGFLGAFTTFSAFSLETLTLLEAGRGGLALAYALASVACCLGAVWAAVTLARVL